MRVPITHFLLISFLAPFITYCQVKKKDRFYPAEYLYPLNKLGKGKTYVYEDIGGTQYNYTDVIPMRDHNQPVIAIRHRTTSQTVDSLICSENWLLLDSYLFLPGSGSKALKGKILEDDVIDDGSRLGKHISRTEYSDPGFVLTVATESVFVKDTVIYWQDKKFDCIKTHEPTTIKFKSTKDSSNTRQMEIIFDGFLAKGIGAIRYTGGLPEKPETFVLMEIREIDDGDKKNK